MFVPTTNHIDSSEDNWSKMVQDDFPGLLSYTLGADIERRPQNVSRSVSFRDDRVGTSDIGLSEPWNSMSRNTCDFESDSAGHPGSVDSLKALPQNTFHHARVVYDSPEDLANLKMGSRFSEEFDIRFNDRVADVLALSTRSASRSCNQCSLLNEMQCDAGLCTWMYTRYAWTGPPSGLADSMNGWGGIPLNTMIYSWGDSSMRDGSKSPSGMSSRYVRSEESLSRRSEISTSGTYSMYKDEDVIEVFEFLGSGSFGKVYRAYFNGVERAVKFLSVEWGGMERVLREAEIGCFLQHPNIVRTFAYRLCDADHTYLDAMSTGRLLVDPDFSASKRNRSKTGLHYAMAPQTERLIQVQIVQELCEFGPLSQHVYSDAFFNSLKAKSQGVVTKLDCIVLVTLDIINALIYLGYNGIIHGDLSCDNILFKEDVTSPIGLRAKVVDFGRSRVEKGTSLMTNTLGTVMYMPPEMVLDGKLNKTSDIYAVGVLLIEMWTNRPAWEEKQPVQILFAMSSGKRITIPDDFPDAMKNFVKTCLSDDLHERPTTEAAFETLKDMVDTKILATHLVATSVASRLCPLVPVHASAQACAA